MTTRPSGPTYRPTAVDAAPPPHRRAAPRSRDRLSVPKSERHSLVAALGGQLSGQTIARPPPLQAKPVVPRRHRDVPDRLPLGLKAKLPKSCWVDGLPLGLNGPRWTAVARGCRTGLDGRQPGKEKNYTELYSLVCSLFTMWIYYIS
jgi:hypothetical protein